MEIDGEPGIFVMEADGSSLDRVTRPPGRDAKEFHSRDGRPKLFQSPRANGVITNLYVQTLEWLGLRQFTDLR